MHTPTPCGGYMGVITEVKLVELCSVALWPGGDDTSQIRGVNRWKMLKYPEGVESETSDHFL